MDCWRGYDSRTENLLLTNCPDCNSMHVLNADEFIERYEGMQTRNKYTYSFTPLYELLKPEQEKFHQTKYVPEYPDVYLSDKERSNSKRKV